MFSIPYCFVDLKGLQDSFTWRG